MLFKYAKISRKVYNNYILYKVLGTVFISLMINTYLYSHTLSKHLLKTTL